MERLEQYRQAIQTLLFSYAQPGQTEDSGIETQVICDRDRDHYQLVSLGVFTKGCEAFTKGCEAIAQHYGTIA
jgi:XisI protein